MLKREHYNSASGEPCYFKEIYLYPDQYYDLILTNLRTGGVDDLKAVSHHYSRAGDLLQLCFSPHYLTDSLKNRSFYYEYDKLGRLLQVHDGESVNRTVYAQYKYNPEYGLDTVLYGLSEYNGVFDTLQAMNYSYNPRGMLTGIGDPLGVTASQSGNYTAPHFGLSMEYVRAQDQEYYNGRPKSLKSTVSGGATTIEHNYDFVYNELGWLLAADHQTIDDFDRLYEYNRLGNRKSLVEDTTQIDYVYYDSLPGSSRLKSFTGMAHDIRYDVLGNMISDTSKGIYFILLPISA